MKITKKILSILLLVTVLLTSSVNVWAKSEEGETLKFRFYNEEGKEINISKDMVATVYKGNIIKNLIMDCQSYTKYRPNETTGGIFVSWRRKEELPTGA